jgi:hypothetical protein
MEIKYTNHFLSKLEDIFAESDYILRYEKGNFQSGFCVLNANKIAIVNKYYSLDGKINSLIEILKSTTINTQGLNEKNQKLYAEITQTEFQF